MGGFSSASAASANYAQQASEARLQGQLQRRQAYADAYKLEADSASAGQVAALQMRQMRQNAVADVQAVRAQAGASGFAASSGSVFRAGEMSLAEQMEAAIDNARLAYATQDRNAREQAWQLRKEGELAERLGGIQGNYYSKMSSVSGNVAPWALLGDGLTLGSNLIFTYGGRR